MRSYSVFTMAAPMAVSSASAKPSCKSARRMAAKSLVANSAIKEGATLATTGRPLCSSAFTAGISSRTCFASCGQFTKQQPHKMHSSEIMLACPSENLMLFTGQ